MKANRRTFLKGVAAGGVSLSVAGLAGGTRNAQFIVAADGSAVERRIAEAGFDVLGAMADGTAYLVEGRADRRETLADVTGVQHVSRNVTFELEEPAVTDSASGTTDDEFYPLQWDKQVTDAPAAHETATGADARIAIIDTGIDVDHPDLESNVNADAGRLFEGGSVTADDVDVYGHGTHVAGIAAASNDGETGVVGSAPDAELVSLRVFYYDDYDDDGEEELTTTTGDILLAIDHAADMGADAANMSIGTAPLPPQVNATGIRVAYERVAQDATRRGTVIVVSAGNSDADLQKGGYFTVPNSVAGAMSISATGPNDELTFYSNYGTNEITVGAPGGGYETLEKTLQEEGVEWPFPTNLVLNAMDPDSTLGRAYGGAEYLYLAGTSMAAPQVTGLAALVREVNPDANARQVEQAIKDGAEGVNGESSAELGAGRINAARTLESL